MSRIIRRNIIRVVLIAICIVAFFIVMFFIPPFVKTIGTVINVHDDGYISPLYSDDPNIGRYDEVVDRYIDIQYYSFLHIEYIYTIHQQYLGEYPYDLKEGTAVEIVYNPIFPSSEKLLLTK